MNVKNEGRRSWDNQVVNAKQEETHQPRQQHGKKQALDGKQMGELDVGHQYCHNATKLYMFQDPQQKKQNDQIH